MKKAVFTIFTVVVLLLISINAYANGSAKIGGTFVNSDQSTFTLSVDDQWEKDKWQRVLEFDYLYKENDNTETLNEFYSNAKGIYTFLPKHYVFSQITYDVDKFRADEQRISITSGYGYKLLRTERFKASNEISVGYLDSDLNQQVIYRNSLWFFFKVADRLDFTNKYLIEWGSGLDDYVRNETAFNYNFESGMILGLKNTYTEDPIDNNVLSVTIGYKWK